MTATRRRGRFPPAWRAAPTLDRYLASEILGPFAMALAFVFVLLFAMQLLRGIEVLFGSGVRPSDLVLIAAYQAPHFLVMGMPVALLFAVVLAVGRLAEDRETLALSASGVAPGRLLRAPALIGALAALAGIALGFGPDPRGLAALQLHVNELIKRNMAGDVKPGTFYDALSNMTLYVQEVSPKDQHFTNVMIADDRDPEASLLVLAQEGRVDPHGSGGVLKMLLSDGEIHRSTTFVEDYSVITFQNGTLNVGVERDLLRKNRFGRPREELTPAELTQAAARAWAAGRDRDARAFEVALGRRIASPLAALVFALCAVPLALGRRGGARALGAVAALGAYVGYYVLGRAGEIWAEAGRLPPTFAAHLPNLAFLLAGILLTWRAMRAES